MLTRPTRWKRLIEGRECCAARPSDSGLVPGTLLLLQVFDCSLPVFKLSEPDRPIDPEILQRRICGTTPSSGERSAAALRRPWERPAARARSSNSKLPRIQRVDHVVCIEDIKRGERVRAVPEFLVTWIAYCLLGWIFLDLVKSFRVASFTPLCP